MAKRVIVGMSGGVDSSVAALLLKEAGYDVVGLFMRNWEEKDGAGHCPAESDYADVRRVADCLKIPFYTVDFAKEYGEEVFSEFLREYKKGRTPNPDVLCNSKIKFGVFREKAKQIGGDFIATGHYCGVRREGGKIYLIRAADEAKDQTYFLNQISEAQIADVIFPLQNLLKSEVRAIAERNGFVTAAKKSSTGICFIGERNFRQFLGNYLPAKPGKIKTLGGETVGTHGGVFFYTIGQRRGFGLGGSKGEKSESPWYVVAKDVENNVLYVSRGEPPELFSKILITEKFHFINDTKLPDGSVISARIRHRQPLQKARFYNGENSAKIIFDVPQRAIAPGQYCVAYDGDICLGGGVIASSGETNNST